ncbi:hypothetical protein BD311DRAFT_316762 [Dichomitus squalens]|uniref:Uncharacterized protein n=1 Tax=Dichomitus squalens TaxID=114155 RepID=A0A4Q9MN72_9APHY|nr:hypothetical protein BD311DRAFT_316762 [Dichomitus squalens]
MLVHLRDCSLTPDHIRQQAREEHERVHLSPRREKGKTRAQPPGPYVTLQPIPFPLAPGAVQSGPSLAMGTTPPAASTLPSAPSLTPISIPALPPPDTPTTSSASYSQSPQLLYTFSTQPSPSGSPNPNLSSLFKRHESPHMSVDSPASKRLRRTTSSSLLGTPVPQSELAKLRWDDARQALYESHIARLTAAGSWSLSWTESPQWLSFCDNFLPMSVINPTRKVLTSRIIPAEVEVYRTQARTECRQKLGTVQCDGFNPKNRHHIVAFMLTVPDKKVLIDIVAVHT